MLSRRFTLAALAVLATAAAVAASSLGEPLKPATWSADPRFPKIPGKLVKVVALNRHGHRTPNAPYWQLCPNASHTRRGYNRPEDLTGLGAAQEYRAGKDIRKTYGALYGEDQYDNLKVYAQAVGEPRTIQSAEIVLQAMYEKQKVKGRPYELHHTTVPVFSTFIDDEYLIDSGTCFGPIGAAKSASFKTDRLKSIVADPANVALMKSVLASCGSPPLDLTDGAKVQGYVKFVNDGLVFDEEMGLKPLTAKDGWPHARYFAFRNLSTVLLLQSLLGTPAQVTMSAGELPMRIIQSFLVTAQHLKTGHDWMTDIARQVPFSLYVMHREEMYAMMLMLKINVALKDLPETEIPCGTNVFFELWENGGNYSVAIKMVTASWGEQLLRVPDCSNSSLCTLREFINVLKAHVKSTGDWRQLCGGPSDDTWSTVDY